MTASDNQIVCRGAVAETGAHVADCVIARNRYFFYTYTENGVRHYKEGFALPLLAIENHDGELLPLLEPPITLGGGKP